MTFAIDLTGQRFGRWVVLARLPNRGTGKQTRAFWACRCDCGTEQPVAADGLQRGASLSCGCLNVWLATLRGTRHGMYGTQVYRCWGNMRRRCQNPRNPKYPDYGGRGIRVDPRWESFDQFYADMGDPPPKRSLDRIDNDGPYAPDNCRWARATTQNRNQRPRARWTESEEDMAMPVQRTKQKVKRKRATVADRVTRLRVHLGLSVATFAKRLEATPQMVEAWEAGLEPLPKRGVIAAHYVRLWHEAGLDRPGRPRSTPPPTETIETPRPVQRTTQGPPPAAKKTKAAAPERSIDPTPAPVQRTTHPQPLAAPAPPAPPTGEQYGAYLHLFHYFNRMLFEARLPEVMLHFSGSAKNGGFYAPERWQKGEQKTAVLALNPKAISQMTPERLVSVLVHEMCHHWQFTEGTPGRRGYHNVEWANRMEALGLIPSDTGRPDGRRTGSHMDHYIAPDGAFTRAFAALPEAYLLPWLSLDRFGRGPSKDPSKTPYTCPRCGVKVWGKPDLDRELLHIKCGEPMKADA